MPVLWWLISTHSFAWTSRGSCNSWGSDEGTVVDRTALYAFGTYRWSILGDLSSDHALTQLQYLLIRQSWTLHRVKWTNIFYNRNQYLYSGLKHIHILKIKFLLIINMMIRTGSPGFPFGPLCPFTPWSPIGPLSPLGPGRPGGPIGPGSPSRPKRPFTPRYIT